MPDSNGRFIPELWVSAVAVSRLLETSPFPSWDRWTLPRVTQRVDKRGTEEEPSTPGGFLGSTLFTAVHPLSLVTKMVHRPNQGAITWGVSLPKQRRFT
jgi:hypothetical protein